MLGGNGIKLWRNLVVFAFAALLSAGLVLGCSGDDGKDGVTGPQGPEGPEGPVGPVISNISVLGAPVYPGGQVEVLVSAHSTDEEAVLSYEWDVPAGWESYPTALDEQLLLIAPEEIGEKATLSIVVSDGEREASGSILLATRGPVIESFSVTPLPLEDEATFEVAAINYDGMVMNYHYDIGGMSFDDRGPEWTWEVAPMAMGGIYQLQSIVEDTNGLRASAGINTTMEGVSPWPVFGGDRQRTGLNRNPDARAAQGVLGWHSGEGDEAIIGGGVRSPVIGVDGTVYVGSTDGSLYAFHQHGTEKWSFATGWGVWSSPAIGVDGTIYVGSRDNRLYAVNPDGSERWSFLTDDVVQSTPVIGADGTIYVGSWDNRLYAVNPDGSERWSFLTDGDVASSPALAADGTIYVGSRDGNVYAVNPDGSLQWIYETEGRIWTSSPAVSPNGTIYVGSHDNHVHAINPDGSQKWSFQGGSFKDSSPALAADGTIYVGSADGNVYAINPDGSQRWTFPTDGEVWSSPAVGADGTIYVGSNDGNVYAINPDGGQRWSFPTGAAISFSSPAVGDDGTVYIGSDDNKLYSIGWEWDVIVTEDFEAAFPPAGWTVVNNGGDCVWQRNDAAGRDNYAGGEGFSAAADAASCGSGTTMDTELRTAFDLSEATRATLDFVAAYNYSLWTTSFQVRVSTDNGNSWDSILGWYMQNVDPMGPGAPVSLDLTPYVGSENVVVSFRFTESGGYGWAQVDQVAVHVRKSHAP